jgi:hypothetical protein
MAVIVRGVLIQDCARVPRPGDEQPVGDLGPGCAYAALGINVSPADCVVTAQSTWKKSHANMVDAWVRRNCRHVDRERSGAGGILSRFSTLRTVGAPTR